MRGRPSILLLGVSLVIGGVGCSTERLGPIDEIGEIDGGPGGAGGEGGGEVESPYTRRSISGEVVWTVTFDDAAKAAGAVDCTYTRRYVGSENASRPWQCPACEGRFQVAVEIVDGFEDCFTQVSTREPESAEWIGYGEGPWWRSRGGLMGEQGTATLDGGTLRIENQVLDLEAPNGGTLQFAVAGELTVSEEAGDPLHGFRASAQYTCGWPKADPPPYTGDYLLTVGEVVPDGVFDDRCGDKVRLHDLAGRYLVVDMSAIDCPPCRQQAALEEAFVSEMEGLDVPVHVVTLLAPSLAEPLAVTTPLMLNDWVETFGLSDPVLADRGWGLSEFLPAIGDATGFPSWVIVDPELVVVAFDTGFNGWGTIRDTILAHRDTP